MKLKIILLIEIFDVEKIYKLVFMLWVLFEILLIVDVKSIFVSWKLGD